MKSSLNSTVLVSVLVALVAVLAGCGDDDSQGGGASCAQICVNVEAAKCKNDPDCMSTCNTLKDSTPMGCTGSYDALTACYVGAKFTCDAEQESVAKDCSKQESAYAKCRQSGGKDDVTKDAGAGNDDGDNAGSGGDGDNAGNGGSAGDDAMGNAGAAGSDGTGGTGGGDNCSGMTDTSECGQCLQGSCCDDLVACQNDSDCPALSDCVGNCSDSSCQQACADSASSSAIDLYNAFIDCATQNCESECSDDGSSGSDPGMSGGDSDVGAPNDGNGGHASGTTPPNCLAVPSDATGYCEEVKYKVIYDCPDGPPYDDCELNEVDASGIYCCGH